MVDSQELDNVGMPESTQYRAFFLEATSGVSYSLLVGALLKHGPVRNKPERSVPFRVTKTRNAPITDH